MTLSQLLKLIRGAGKKPAERDSFYNVIHEFADDELREVQSHELVAASA